MIVGIGIDVASIERMRAAIGRYGDRFVRRILTDKELELLASRVDPSEGIAARFAVKEAVYKALGGPKDVFWHQIEVGRESSGAPCVELHRQAKAHADRLGVSRIFISITHDAGVAAAMAVLEG